MKNQKLLLAALFAFASTSSIFAPNYAAIAAPAQAKISGYVIDQHAAMENEFKITLTPEAIRADNFSKKYSLIARAPDWKITVWRPDQKIMSTVTFDDWTRKFQFRRYAWTCDLEKPFKTVKSELFGIKTKVYYYGSTAQVGIFMRTSFGDGTNKNDKNHAEIHQMDYPGSEHTGLIIGRLQMAPKLPGFPLEVVRIRENGHIEGAISTTKIEKSAAIDSAIFTPPSGYRLIPFEVNKFMRLEAINNMEKDFADNFLR